MKKYRLKTREELRKFVRLGDTFPLGETWRNIPGYWGRGMDIFLGGPLSEKENIRINKNRLFYRKVKRYPEREDVIPIMDNYSFTKQMCVLIFEVTQIAEGVKLINNGLHVKDGEKI